VNVSLRFARFYDSFPHSFTCVDDDTKKKGYSSLAAAFSLTFIVMMARRRRSFTLNVFFPLLIFFCGQFRSRRNNDWRGRLFCLSIFFLAAENCKKIQLLTCCRCVRERQNVFLSRSLSRSALTCVCVGARESALPLSL
jgi:hypothetical protein